MTHHKTSRKDVAHLSTPKPSSHKWQNGAVLVIGGSHRYHGAPMFAVQTVARFVDMVHFASPENYADLLPKMRKKMFEFIPVFSKELPTYIEHVDVVLIGPGLEVNKKNTALIRNTLKRFPQKKFVLDAGAIRMMDPKLYTPLHIVTPNKRELKDVFKVSFSPSAIRSLAKKLNISILAKGTISYVATPTQYAENHTGNAGLTKGGTGDILAGLIAAFYTKNPSFLSVKAASFLLGKTADSLQAKRSFAYSATDVMDAIPQVFGRLHRP